MQKVNHKETSVIVEKWNRFLAPNEEIGWGEIKSRTRKEITAHLLENQQSWEATRTDINRAPMSLLGESMPVTAMGASSATPGAGPMDIYNPVLISLIRRTVPNLVAYDLCGVQPMSGPNGLIFAFRPRYANSTGAETWVSEANTFTSASVQGSANSTNIQVGLSPALANSTQYTTIPGVTTATLEGFGSDASNLFNEMSFTIESVRVDAKGRGLRASFSQEVAQDLRAVHGLSAEDELAAILAQQILFDINREIIRSINYVAVQGANTGTANAGIFNLDIDSDGRWSVEKFKGMLFRFEREANQIAKDTRRGKGNFIICGSDVASALRMTGLLDYNPQMSVDLKVDDTGNTFAGVLNGSIKVYIDPYFQNNGYEYATIGYKGASEFDAGLFYCPYVPLEYYQARDPQSFQPAIAFKTRYGMVSNPFAQPMSSNHAVGTLTSRTNQFYRIIAISNLT